MKGPGDRKKRAARDGPKVYSVDDLGDGPRSPVDKIDRIKQKRARKEADKERAKEERLRLKEEAKSQKEADKAARQEAKAREREAKDGGKRKREPRPKEDGDLEHPWNWYVPSPGDPSNIGPRIDATAGPRIPRSDVSS